jgi:pyruvate dehydrogenase E1 component beta subunit
MAKLNMVQAINRALDEMMGEDPDVVVLGEDVGVDGGVFRVTEGLHAKYGEARVIDTPLAESGIIGSAIGMALGGLKPVGEMQFSGFSYLMIPQLEGHASRLRSRTQGQFGVPLVMRLPYGGGVRALEHHSESREVYYAHTPGVKVVVPSGPRNARALMRAAILDPDPVVFMEPKRSYRAFREEVPEKPEVAEIGRSVVEKEGTDITVVAWGAMMHTARKAVVEVEKARGVSVELIDVQTLMPLDSATIAESVRKTGRLAVVQEAPRTYGAAAEIVACVNDQALLYLEAPAKRITGYDVVTPYFGRENLYIPTVGRTRRGIEEALDF